MKYIVKNKNSYEYVSDNELLHLLLKQRGVEDPELLLNLTPDVLYSEFEQPFMDFGVRLLHHHVENNSRIHIIVDSDCFTGDTKIKMLDGTVKTFEELVEMEKENPNQDYWVYSCDEQGNIKAGRGYAPRITSYKDKIYHVELDNGEVIKCSDNHRFMLRDGSYKEAQYLQEGDSLMPLYTKRNDGKYNYDREMVMNNHTQKYEFTHHMVYDACNNTERSLGHHVHHVDRNYLNNKPSNLRLLTKEEHLRTHAKEHNGFHHRYNGTQKHINDIKNGWAKGSYDKCTWKYTYNGSDKHKEDVKRAWKEGKYQKGIDRIKAYNKTEANKEATRKLNKDENVKKLQARGKASKIGKKILDLGYELTQELIMSKEYLQHDNWGIEKCMVNGKEIIKRSKGISMETINKYFDSFDDFVNCSMNYNHKVKCVTIETLDTPIPLYDITVEQYHNFALALEDESGVFVHNCDGYTSSALMYQYLKGLNMEVTFSIHVGKAHGIREEVLNNFDFDLLIVPDAGSSDFEWHERLADEGKDVIILDHHEYEYEQPTSAIVINNQHPQAPNPTLSGVGMTYKFCRAYDRTYGHSFANGYLDLVATGVIGDSMDLRNPETRFLVLEGLKQFGQGNQFLSLLFEKQSFSMKNKATIMSVGWFIVPIINAVVRSGSQEDKENLFKAMANIEGCIPYKPRRKSKNDPMPEVEMQPLPVAMVRIATSIKTKQDKEAKKGIELVEERIESLNLTDNKMIIVDVTDILPSAFTGLVANKLATAYKRPVLLLRDDSKSEGFYGGSGRNYSKFALDNLNTFLTETNLFEFVQGHQSAFGLSLNKANVKDLIRVTNEKLSNVDIEDVYHVDFAIPFNRLKEKHLVQVGKFGDLWGNTLHEPTFVITDISVDSSQIQLAGEKKNRIKIEVERNGNKITFVKKFTNEDLYNKIIHHNPRGLSRSSSKRLDLKIIGKFVIDEWTYEGKTYTRPIVEIVDIESTVAPNRKIMF